MKAKEITIVVTEAQLADIVNSLKERAVRFRNIAKTTDAEEVKIAHQQDAIELEELAERLEG